MLSDIDKESLKYNFLIQFCEKYSIIDIDAHYYLKLAYEQLKDKMSEKEIENIFIYMYNAFDEHFYGMEG